MLTSVFDLASTSRRAPSALSFLAALALAACGESAGDAASPRPERLADALGTSDPPMSEPASASDDDAPIAAPDAGAAKGCSVGERSYAVGDTFHDALRCNTCSCTADGIVCTAKFCDPRQACMLGDRSFAAGTSVVCEDGCNRCQCVDRAWTTTLALCSGLPAVERCDDAPAGVARTEVLYRKGDALALSIGTGGCQTDTPPVKLCWDGQIAESFPVQMRLRVVPINETPCSGWVTQERTFDLTPLKEAYREAYPGLNGIVRVRIGNESVPYAF